MAVGAFCVELQHLQIQGCHCLKSALNLDVTRSNARASGTFFDQFFFHGCRCFLRRVVVILLQQNVPANPMSHAQFQFCAVNHVFENELRRSGAGSIRTDTG